MAETILAKHPPAGKDLLKNDYRASAHILTVKVGGRRLSLSKPKHRTK